MVSTGTTPFAKTILNTYICPSDPGSGLNPDLGGGGTAGHIYAKSNYIGVFSAHYHATDPTATDGGVDRPAVFIDNVARNFRDVTDGLSNTVFVVERGTKGNPTGSLWTGYHLDSGGGISGTIAQFQVRLRMERNNNDTDYIINGKTVYNPSSQHTGGTHCLKGDGAVIFLSENINLRVQAALGTMDGDEIIPEI
jgi:hypothetical protein